MISILVAGPGCYNCRKLKAMCKEIVEEKNIDAAISEVSDMNQIAALSVMMTPGLLINGTLVSSGRVPSKEKLEQWIVEATN
ncbi:thioredoxin family protein [Candidatus Neomarinimicrobiota bacterium]